MATGIATRPGRPLPGQDFHLLEQRTFHGTRGLVHQEAGVPGEPLGEEEVSGAPIDGVHGGVTKDGKRDTFYRQSRLTS